MQVPKQTGTGVRGRVYPVRPGSKVTNR